MYARHTIGRIPPCTSTVVHRLLSYSPLSLTTIVTYQWSHLLVIVLLRWFDDGLSGVRSVTEPRPWVVEEYRFSRRKVECGCGGMFFPVWVPQRVQLGLVQRIVMRLLTRFRMNLAPHRRPVLAGTVGMLRDVPPL